MRVDHGEQDVKQENTPESRLVRARELREQQRSLPWREWTIRVPTGTGYGGGATEPWCESAPEDLDPDEPSGCFGIWEGTIGDFLEELKTTHEARNSAEPKSSCGWVLAGEQTPGRRRRKDEAGPFYFAAADFDGLTEAQLAHLRSKVEEWGVFVLEVATFSDKLPGKGRRRRMFVFFETPLGLQEYLAFVNALDHVVVDADGEFLIDPAGLRPVQPVFLMPHEGAERMDWIEHNAQEKLCAASNYANENHVAKRKWRVVSRDPKESRGRSSSGYVKRDDAKDEAAWKALTADEQTYRMTNAINAVSQRLDLPPEGGNGRYDQALVLLRVGNDWGIPIHTWAGVLVRESRDKKYPLTFDYISSRDLWRAYTGCSTEYGSYAIPSPEPPRTADGKRSVRLTMARTSALAVLVFCSLAHAGPWPVVNYLPTPTTSQSRTTEDSQNEPTSIADDGSRDVPITNDACTPPEQRALAWSEYFTGEQSGVIRAPMGSGKGRLVRILREKVTDLAVVCPTVALSHQAAEDFDIPHYAVDPARPSATSLMSVMSIKGSPYIVVDEAHECFGQLFTIARENFRSVRILNFLADAWNDGRLLLMGADLERSIVDRFVAYAKDRAGGNVTPWLWLDEPHPVLVKNIKSDSIQEGRNALLDSLRDNDRYFVFCTSQAECHNLAQMVLDAGGTAAIFDRDSDRSIGIDELFEQHNYVFSTSAAASGMNIRTPDVKTMVFDTYDGVAPHIVIQGIGRVRRGTEVEYYLNRWTRREAKTDFEALREDLETADSEARRELIALSTDFQALRKALLIEEYEGKRELTVKVTKNEKGTHESETPLYWDLYAQIVLEENREKVDRIQVLNDAIRYAGWNGVIADPVEGDENPTEYGSAKRQAKERQVDDIVHADVDLATDSKNLAGTHTRPQLLANHKRRIERMHGVTLDPTDPEHRELVWADRDGKMTRRSERSVLAQLSAECEDLVLYDAKIKRIRGGGLKFRLNNQRVKQARFFAKVWTALTGRPPGQTGALPQDSDERILELLNVDEYSTTFPKRKRPTTPKAARRALITLMRQYGRLSQFKPRRGGDDRTIIYTLHWAPELAGMSRETVLETVRSKRAMLSSTQREQLARQAALDHTASS